MNVLNNLFKGDKGIWTVYLLLCIISIVEVYSASSSMTYKSGAYWSPVLSHTAFLLVGTVIVIVVHNIPCKYFKLIPVFLLPLCIVLLAYVAFFKRGSVNDAARWFSLFGIRFQPSELAKGTMVVTTALILSAMQTDKGADKRAFKYILGVTLLICALIVPENFSTAALLFFVIVMMMFIGQVSMIQLSKLFGVIAILGVAVVLLIKAIPSDDLNSIGKKVHFLHRMDTWVERVNTHADNQMQQDPNTYKIADNELQRVHGNIAIATCNVIGKGPGNSTERDFLPQAYSDFIYAIIIEELGLVGGALVVFLYIVLIVRAGRIASHCERSFPAFLVMGLALLMVTQAMLNMLVAVGVIPVTGQTLPLISRGGTSVLVNCCYIGMILSVSRYAKKKPEEKGKSNVKEEPTEYGPEAPYEQNM
jgi:cell division protein FtsW